MLNKEVVKYKYTDDIEIGINIFKSIQNRKNKSILYFHGGGMVSGVRDDFPDIYIDEFLKSGYDFVSLDYPLAPESKIDIILDACYNTVLYVINEIDKKYNLNNLSYILFGRSAGTYITFMTCNELIKNKKSTPEALIGLYGYTRLDEIEFDIPSPYYNKMTKVSNEIVKSIITDKIITYGSIMERYLIYINARQQCTWIKYICGNENPLAYSLSDDDLKCFPPTILAAATNDPDVPYRISCDLNRKIKNSELITIDSDVHDFDRDVNNEQGLLTYKKIISWLENIEK